MTERYRSRTPEQSGPARQGFAITPSDASTLTSEIRALYVGAAGDLALVLAAGDTVTLKVARLSARVDAVSQTVEIEADVEGSGAAVLPGMSGQARAPSGR